MAMDKRVSKKIPDYYRREESAVRLDSGPYIGKVKNNLDPTRSGRVQVYIPDLASGDENNPEFWRTVAYASPFFGSTTQPDSNKQNAFSKVKHTYGMWAVPPDVGNLVLCTFVAGDPNRGFWFACIPNQLGHHMTPGVAGSYNVDGGTIEDSKVKSAYNGKPTVVSEFNENDENIDWANFVNLKKPIHEHQYKVYLNQGLEEDYIRGIISSSSQRESPSYVFGISTPGRPVNDPAMDPDYNQKIVSGSIKESDYAVAARKGGHAFVMDDGNFQDKDRLVRLRTAGGHQLLMNDSEQILYIGNSNGSVWMEMTGAGHLNVYSASSVNIRAGQDLNFHADRNINLNAGSDINMSAGKKLQAQAQILNLDSIESTTVFGGGKLNLGSDGSVNINTSGTTNVVGSAGVNVSGATVKLNNGVSGSANFNRPTQLKFNKLSDTGKQGDKWVSVNGSLPTIVAIAPSHEPWSLHQPTTLAGLTGAVGPSPISSSGGYTGTGNGVTAGPAPVKDCPVVECKASKPADQLDPGPKEAAGQGVTKPVNKSFLARADAPTVTTGIGPLTPDMVKALMTQIGWTESGCKYNIVNTIGFCGKYQFGAAALVETGHIKRDAFTLYGGNKAIGVPSAWTGKDGLNSKEDFLNNGPVQEKLMQFLLKMNYNNLVRNGAIKEGDDLCTVAGMMAVAQLLGASGAKKWRLTGGGVDAYGTTGSMYFNRGRYAVDVLAAPA